MNAKAACAKFIVALLALLLGGCAPAQAQAPAWQLAIAPGQTAGSTSLVQAMVADSSGRNLYLVGYFLGTVSFGASTLSSAGDADVFVAKWNTASRTFAWARRAGGSRSDVATAVAVQGSNVYVAGSFLGVGASFGPVSLTAAPGTSGSPADIFVAKLTDAGSTADFEWAVRAGGEAEDGVGGLAVWGRDVYVAGSFASRTADFGTTVLVNANSSNDTSDMFLAQLFDAGALATFGWAQREGGPSTEAAGALVVAGSTLYVSGTFNGPSIRFGNTTLTKTAGSGAYSTDAFVVKYAATATGADVGWAQSLGGPDNDAVAALQLKGSLLYLAGDFRGTATVGNNTLTSVGGSDVFVTRLADAGASSRFEWAVRAGGAGPENLRGLALHGSALYLTGNYYGATTILGRTTLPNATTDERYSDLFVARLTDAGPAAAFAWAQRAGGADYDFGGAVAVVDTVVYVAGGATPAFSFGSHALVGPVGRRIAYLAALGTAPVPADPSDPTLPTGNCLVPGPAGTCPVRIPTIITPNGDGLNDRFVCQNLSAGAWELTVYSRWGQPVYRQPAYRNAWDATGQSAGLYYYLLHNPVSGARYRSWVEVIR